ncbi:MAG: helix-hairpin-helix domain-containing protein [Halodesulfurarchaeum sp.]
MTTRMAPEELTDVKFVGPATKAVLEREDVVPADIIERRLSHAQLIEMGVNPGVAARIRREHSLSWSLEGGEDLDRRAEQVRGLQDGERAWVAASAGTWDNDSGEVDSRSGDGNGTPEDEEAAWRNESWPAHGEVESESTDAEAEWRERSQPTPVTEISGIGEAYASRLAEAGINSVRSLATCDPRRVAESLDLSVDRVRGWRDSAQEQF